MSNMTKKELEEIDSKLKDYLKKPWLKGFIIEEAGPIDIKAAQRLFTERNYNRFIDLNKKITDARKRNV